MKVIDYFKRMFNKNKNQQLLNAPKTRYQELVESIDDIELSNMFISRITPDLIDTIKQYKGNQYEYPLQTKISTDNTIELTQKFFESIDKDISRKVNDIINGNNPNIILKIENYNSKGAYVSNPNQMPIIVYIPLKQDLRQLYEMIHELTHTLDIDNGDTTTRRVLGEVAPQCMERMLDNYLLTMTDNELNKYGFNKTILEKDIQDRRLSTFASRFHNTQNLNNRKGNRELDSRYMLAQIYSSHFNNLDKSKKKGKLISFIESVKNDDFDEANNCFGLLMNRNLRLHRELYVRNTISEADNIRTHQNINTIQKQRDNDLTRDDIS
ncbi:MAG: hypothetical protein E7313_06675 [Clostridiales bacterium]|nr:hypothetical protein [Clostridiales bacterium]